ncbi:MAG: helix-turn-helix domain-containing protein [Leucobacter sp.]
MTTPEAFGAAVRRRRAELGITLDQLALASGVSAGALSRIERGTLNTSLQNAAAIAGSLGSALDELLAPAAAPVVLRSGEGQLFADPDTGVQRRLLARPAAGLEVIHYLLPGRAVTADFAAHRPRTLEVFHVIAGSVRVVAGGEALTLAPGDTAQLPGDRPHRIENAGDEAAKLILVITTPGDRPAAGDSQ